MRAAYLCVLFVAGCSAFTPKKSSDCDATVNRCMESCDSMPDKLAEPSHAAGHTRQASPVRSGCEDRCRNQCR
jgi:hypothetical protein